MPRRSLNYYRYQRERHISKENSITYEFKPMCWGEAKHLEKMRSSLEEADVANGLQNALRREIGLYC